MRAELASQVAYETSLLRPGMFLMCQALTSISSNELSSSR